MTLTVDDLLKAFKRERDMLQGEIRQLNKIIRVRVSKRIGFSFVGNDKIGGRLLAESRSRLNVAFVRNGWQ